MSDLVERLRALAEKATPVTDANLARYEHGGGRLAVIAAGGRDEANREFYAACDPQTILAILARITELEALITARENARIECEDAYEACLAAERARIRELEGELAKLSLPGGLTVNCLRLRTCSERAKLEGERDTATRALEAIGSLAVMSEGNVAGGVVSSREVDAIINAALSKTEKKGDN